MPLLCKCPYCEQNILPDPDLGKEPSDLPFGGVEYRCPRCTNRIRVIRWSEMRCEQLASGINTCGSVVVFAAAATGGPIPAVVAPAVCAWGAAEDIVLGHYREDSWRRNSGLIGLAGSGLGVLSEAQAVACAEHVPAASSGYIAGGIERLKRGLGFSKSAIDAGRAARAPPPAPVLRMRAAAYAGGQFIRSMAATAVGWCPREEALEVQEVEMKVFNFKNLEDLEHLEPTRQFDEEVEEVEGWLLLPEDSEALVRQEFADVLRMSGELPLNCWALAV
ncbi:unnamed protein product [Cladocopium goreaui]|uniref:Uncharacterized protein n=2 Tax=Cladocopium goreaui TaxID=2562237 RepID=A0A9P1GRV0_9DINO|nr:unnamed protein product [Cladocopium goreaui]